MKYKKRLFTFFISFFVMISLPISILFIYDPLRIFHKPWLYKDYLQPNMRQQAVGIIKNIEFDSAIIGSSLLEGTSSKEAGETVGGKFINISLAGSSYYERSMVLEYLFKRKSIKSILYSLDNSGLYDTNRGEKRVYNITNWSYLYDDNPLNDVKVYLNDKYLKCLLYSINKEKCMGRIVTMDRPSSLYQSTSDTKKFKGLNNCFDKKSINVIRNSCSEILKIIKIVNRKEVITEQNSEIKNQKSIEYLNENLLKFVSKHRDTTFYFVIPPYPRFSNATLVQYNKSAYKRWQNSLKYLISLSSLYKNMKIYGWGNEPFTEDLSNYRDKSHYSHLINSWMLKSIEQDRGRLTISNIDKYLQEFTDRSTDYNLSTMRDKLKRYLQK